MKFSRFIIAAVVAVLCIGCRGGSEKPLRYIGFKVYDPVYVAYEKGFFENHGVNVRIIEMAAAGPTALQAVSGRSAEACLSFTGAVINARAAGLPVLAVSDIQSSIGEQPLEEFFVRSDSGIETITGLKGKKVAINIVKASFHYTWLMAMEAAGMSETDIEFVVLPFENQELAIDNGLVDAIGLMLPYAGRARKNPAFRTLFTALDVFGERQFCAHVVNSDWAQRNRKQAEGFVAAIADAVTWIEANQTGAKAIIAQYTGIDIADIDDYHFQPGAAIIPADAQYWLDYMKRRGDITDERLTVDDFATNAFNPNHQGGRP